MEFGDKTLHKSSFEINAFITQILNIYVKIFQDENIDFEVNTVAPTYVDENLTLKISLFKLKEHIRIEVFNSCNAIDTNDLEQIWDPFYKLDKARTREKGGHGLGLSIVKSIQEAHENSFGVKNIDNGVYFWFEIDIK
ncbi:ATP-binding protein [Clostridium sp.]|uniref:ATP-binding protein n=1 Tax=Clostridium sp. TaxID=1506 RepID=UPI0025C07405|nr:ATP-binding protein [Clostridium sp.]